MGLESVTNISDLNATNPLATDAQSQGDDHIRNIKTALLNNFPNITGAVTSTQAELNYVDITTAGTTQLSKAWVSDASNDVVHSGVLNLSGTSKLQIGGVAVTSTAAELNALDGITSTVAELNILDGVTATAAELNALDGITSTVAELNILDGVTSTSTELNKLDGVTTTAAELEHVSGVTSAIQAQLDALTQTPSGAIIAYGGSSAPSGWQLCDGSAISRTTYAALFTAISTTYGVGDGSTTFNVPDLTGRVPAGKESSATRLTSAGGGVDGATLGAVGGGETHTLVTSEMPAHTHTDDVGQKTGSTVYGTTGTATGPSEKVTGSTGGDGAHANVQPTLIINYIIKE